MRTWLIAAALLILPLLVYWPTVSHEYGFRDDYAHLREVRERPGWLMQLTTSNGRPVYGAVLEASLRDVYQVSELEALRLLSTVLIGVRRSAALVALAALGLDRGASSGARRRGDSAARRAGRRRLGHRLADRARRSSRPSPASRSSTAASHRKGRAGLVGVAAGCALYFIAGLTYQTSALFAVMPLAAVLLVRGVAREPSDTKWIIAHLGALFGSLFAGFLLMNVAFTEGVVAEAARMQFEPHPLIKLLWFAAQSAAELDRAVRAAR